MRTVFVVLSSLFALLLVASCSPAPSPTQVVQQVVVVVTATPKPVVQDVALNPKPAVASDPVFEYTMGSTRSAFETAGYLIADPCDAVASERAVTLPSTSTSCFDAYTSNALVTVYGHGSQVIGADLFTSSDCDSDCLFEMWEALGASNDTYDLAVDTWNAWLEIPDPLFCDNNSTVEVCAYTEGEEGYALVLVTPR